jgi:hypothetical protein
VRTWSESAGRAPSPAERAALVEEVVVDEVLYREALDRKFDTLPVVTDRLVKLATFLELRPEGASVDELLRAARAMGLDRGDPIVRRYMVGAVRERLAAEVAGAPFSRAEVAAFHQANPERFRLSGAIRFHHVYVGGLEDAARVRALELSREIRDSALDVPAAVARGDAFYGGHAFPFLDAAEIDRRFGDEFGARASGLAPGVWSEPLRSAYGYHLVRVDEARAPRLQPLAAVETRIASELARERDEAALRNAIAGLRDRYRVELPDAVD